MIQSSTNPSTNNSSLDTHIPVAKKMFFIIF